MCISQGSADARRRPKPCRSSLNKPKFFQHPTQTGIIGKMIGCYLMQSKPETGPRQETLQRLSHQPPPPKRWRQEICNTFGRSAQTQRANKRATDRQTPNLKPTRTRQRDCSIHCSTSVSGQGDVTEASIRATASLPAIRAKSGASVGLNGRWRSRVGS